MKKTLLIILFFLSLTAFGQEFREDRKFEIWNNQSAPHSNGLQEGPVQANLYFYAAKGEKKTDLCIVICPGGAYKYLAMSYEGYEVAEWLASKGISSAVLQYRIPNGVKEVPLEDGIQALRLLREKASLLGISPEKIGMMGFSAGAHLAAYVSNFAADRDKPDFSVLFYPVISSDRTIWHQGTFENLLGTDAGETVLAAHSLDRCVGSTTPPAILFHSDADKVVSPLNSTLYYNALKRNHIEASLHIYPGGGHGWGSSFPYVEAWRAALLDWLDHLFSIREI